MKGPSDNMLDTESSASGKARAPKMEKPPGGKVLARLVQFATERSLPVQEADVATATPVVAKGKTKSASKSAAKKPARSSATEAEGGSTVARDYAASMMAAAIELQQLSTMASAGAVTAAADTFDQLRSPTETGAETVPSMSPPTGIGPQWRFLGPTGMTNGQTYGDTRVIVSGRVSSIAVDPSNANHILCGSAGGGVWESTNRGASWTPRTDYAATLTVGALAFNPSNSQIVYCGTGEGNFYWTLGAGILRSTNGGATWAMLVTTPFVGQGFFDLLVDPGNANRLIAATTGGVYLSTNGGSAWTRVRSSLCWDLSIHPAGGASAEILAACSDGLFRSTNGTTWTQVNLPSGPAGYNRLAVSHCRSNPAVVHVFGCGAPNMAVPGDPSSQQPTPRLWRRTTAGGAFAAATLPADLNTTQAWYDWFLATAPDNAGQVYIGAIEAYRGTLSGSTWTWVKISNKAGDDIHPDQHAIAFDPVNPAVIYIGNDGGLFTSPNRGSNWTSLNPGLGITEVEFMAQDYGSVRFLIAGTQDNGSVRYNGTAAWDHIADGDGGDCGVNRTNPLIDYHSFYSMGMERSTTGGNFGSFSWIGPNVPNNYNALFYPPMEVFNDTVAQAGQSLFISRNRGTSWTEKTLPAGFQRASAMFLPNADAVYIGTENGRICRSTWSGAAWGNTVSINSPRTGAYISDIYVSPTNTNRIWVTYSSLGGGRVYRSDNGGTAWTDCSAGLPNLPINSVEVDPGNANRVWIAADVGVYQSTNAGGGWTAFSNGLPNCLAVDLLYHPHAQVLRVGTRNRGVWEIPVNGWLANPVCGVQFTGTLNAAQTNKWFTFNWPATWHVIWTVMPTTVKSGAPEITWDVQVERANAEFVTYWIVVTNLINQPVSFEGRFAILSYY